jgi:serine/threonine-protein kinase
MERLPGDTLGDQIAQGPLPQTQVYEALRDVLAALAAAHDAGMLHRDIKPGNILLDPSGSVKVGDFGIVKAPGAVHTTTGQLVGTLAYLSPNRIAGNPAAVSDDLYAAGVVGYEALTGRKPFTEEDIVPLARAIIEDRPPPVTALRPDVDPGLAEVIERAMSRDPLRRFPSAQAMRAALRPPTTVMSPLVDAEPTALVVPAVVVRRRSTLLRTVGASAAVVGAVAVAVLTSALEQAPATRPTAPEPVSVSTPAPAPISVTTDVSPIPVIQPLPEPSPVVEQATQREPRENGNGKGDNGTGDGGKGNGSNGNGHGKAK